jgi:hypothetical protein
MGGIFAEDGNVIEDGELAKEGNFAENGDLATRRGMAWQVEWIPCEGRQQLKMAAEAPRGPTPMKGTDVHVVEAISPKQ